VNTHNSGIIYNQIKPIRIIIRKKKMNIWELSDDSGQPRFSKSNNHSSTWLFNAKHTVQFAMRQPQPDRAWKFYNTDHKIQKIISQINLHAQQQTAAAKTRHKTWYSGSP
jgi:hypothetical protein